MRSVKICQRMEACKKRMKNSRNLFGHFSMLLVHIFGKIVPMLNSGDFFLCFCKFAPSGDIILFDIMVIVDFQSERNAKHECGG